MEKEMKCKSIDYTVTLEYGRPDAYNSCSKNYEWEIGIRLDRIWKYFPDFESFLEQIIFYQVVERICMEVGRMQIIKKYQCNTEKCPMELPALIMLNRVDRIPETVSIGY